METFISKQAPIMALISALLWPLACTDSKPSATTNPGLCGLPSPQGDMRTESIPPTFLPVDETQVVQAEPRDDRLIITLSVPASVADSFDAYKQRVRKADFEILLEDFEGFEAELYLKRDRYLAVIEIRASDCDDAAVVRLNLPDGKN
jgi:hypothetical protein